MPQHFSRGTWQHCSPAGSLRGLHGWRLLVSIFPTTSYRGGESEEEEDVITGEIPEQQSPFFLPSRQGPQVKVPVLVMFLVPAKKEKVTWKSHPT